MFTPHPLQLAFSFPDGFSPSYFFLKWNVPIQFNKVCYMHQQKIDVLKIFSNFFDEILEEKKIFVRNLKMSFCTLQSHLTKIFQFIRIQFIIELNCFRWNNPLNYICIKNLIYYYNNTKWTICKHRHIDMNIFSEAYWNQSQFFLDPRPWECNQEWI